MQNLKRVLSLVLVVAMVMSFMIAAGAATGKQLTDLADSKFQPEVRVLNALNIVEGYEDGTYKPAKDVSRAELALILARVRVGGDKEMIASYNYGHMTYTDILSDGYAWAASGIQYCTDNGMVVGDGNGKYRPGDTVTIVEALKMLLTALGYDAEIEGMQNVGAAWKANTLSLAKEVGLMDRFYGDTNKNCTRDDIALLIYNFLMSDVVKGYYENDVANVDTIMYVGGTALEIYFGKQVVYGVVVANEAANLDVHEYALKGYVADDDVTLDAGYTELYLYEDDENGYTLKDYLTGNFKAGKAGKKAAIDNVFTTIKLSTGLSELGESVFVITDLEKTKGYYVAIGDVCFDTGLNTVGVEQWSAPSLKLASKNTVYINDYDLVCGDQEDRNGKILLGNNAGGNGNGDFYKTVDFDGDGALDFVMVENWGMAQVLGANKAGNVKGSEAACANGDWEWTKAAKWNIYTNLAADSATMGVVNFHYADGTFYSVAADSLKSLTLADSKDAVNYKDGYITLSDDNKYYQSDIWNMTVGFFDDIMDCEKDPYNLKSYTWYLDCGGYIRIYGVDPSARPDLYLLTDATSVKSGKQAWDATIETYKESSEAVWFNTAWNNGFILTADDNTYKWDGALAKTALGNTCWTNLAGGFAGEDSITLTDASATGNTIIELQDQMAANKFGTTDDFGKYGDWNINNGGAESEIVYATTETVIYYVVAGRNDLDVTYYEGYKAFAAGVPEFDFDACENVYAAVTTAYDDDLDAYYYANAIVFETYEKNVTTSSPYFSFAHVSGNKDTLTGIYDVVTPAGEIGTYDVSSLSAPYTPFVHGLGFYSYNDNTGAAEMIVENWAAYGISAAKIAIAKTGKVDYFVLNNVGGKEIKVTEETPVYAVMAGGTDKGGYPFLTVKAWEETLAAGDEIILVTAGPAIKYILVVNSPAYECARGEAWSTIVIEDLYDVIAANGSLYDESAKAEALAVAVFNYADNKTAENYDAMLNAYEAFYDVEGWDAFDPTDPKVADFYYYYNEKTVANFNAFAFYAGLSKDFEGKINIDLYLNGTVKDAYDKLSGAEKAFLLKNDPFGWNAYAIERYEEISDADVALAQALIDAAEAYNNANTDAEEILAFEDLEEAYNAFKKLGYTYNPFGDIAVAIALYEGLL